MLGRRVVVTGLGLVTPLGNDVKQTWDNIIAGKSGVTSIDSYDTSDLTTRIYARVKDFDPSAYLENREINRNDTFIHYACAAAQQALLESDYQVTPENAPKIGVAIGSGIGGLQLIDNMSQTLINKGARKITPFFIPGSIINMASGNVALKHGLKGPNISVVTACTTGTHNIGIAARMIAYGDADAMLAGGSEMASTKLGLGGFAAARALSKRNDDPQAASRPWDKDRDGFVLGDGAGVVMLEEYESAKARGANIIAEIAGFGMSDDAYHITAPDPEKTGFIYSMRGALKDAAIDPDAIDYINAHGTSTPALDVVEAAAIKQTFSDAAYKMSISSTKSMIGHLLGAAGAVEAVFSILAIRDQVAPPTINLTNPDEGCEDLDLVPLHAKPRTINYALSNSFGFGGTNATLIFKKPNAN